MNNKYEVGTLILRVMVGVVFFIHGLDKFQMGIGNVAGWFGSIGLPGFLAYVVSVIELVGGIALILGIGTRIASILLGIIMIGAIVTIKGSAGFMGNGQMAGYEYDLVLLAISIYLAIAGSQLYALDSLFRKNKESNTKESAV